MIKFPGNGGAGGAAAGLMKGPSGMAAETIGTAVRSPHGGAAQDKQLNSDLSKVVNDLLHDKLMDKMGGGGGLHLPKGEGGHGPAVPQGLLGGLRGPHGQQSPLGAARQENTDLKNLLGDLLKSRAGGSQGPAAQPQQSALQGENDDLKKLLGDLLKALTGGGQAAAKPQQSQLQGENNDLMKLLSDLLQQKSGGAGESDEASDPASMLENVLKQNKQMKSTLGAMQQMMQSPDQSSPLAMTQQMMTQGA